MTEQRRSTDSGETPTVETWSGVEHTVYRYPIALGLRLLGLLATVLGVVLVVAVVADTPAYLSWLLVALGLVTLVVVVRFVVWPPRVLELSSTGFALRNLRSKGAGAATWGDVSSVATQRYESGPAVVLELFDGREARLPLAALGRRATEAQHEIHARLNTANGYRPL